MLIPADAPNFSPVFLARDAGIFKKHGLSVKIVPLTSGASAAAALLAGSAQFDVGVASDVLQADSKGGNLLAVAAVNNEVAFDVEVNKAYAAAHHITASEPMSQRLLALKGAKIGITSKGSITDLALEYMMQTVGLKTTADYDEVSLGSVVSRTTALQHGEIQAAMFDPAGAAMMTRLGAGIEAIKCTDFPLLAKAAFTQVLVTTGYAKSHPAVVRAAAASLAEANNEINADPGRALPYLETDFPSFKPVLSATLPQYAFTENGTMTAASWKSMAQLVASVGLLSPQGVAKATTYFTNSYLS